MRLVFAGTPAVAVPSLEAVLASTHELVGVLTRPDAPSGRGRTMTPSPVAARAAELGVPLLTPERPLDDEFYDALRALAPDCCPVVAYGALLPESVLDIPEHGWVNLHFSLLPAWRGAAPVQHAIWAGDELSGATTFRIVREVDAGPTYGLMTQRVDPHDTAGDLLNRLGRESAALLVRTLDGIEDGSLEAREQPTDGVSFAPKITVEQARVDWTEPAVAVDRRIRACTPAPGAWSTYAGARLKLGPVQIDSAAVQLAPGELAVDKHTVHVGTGTGPVLLGQVRASGKKPMDAADWARGLRPDPGPGGPLGE